MRKTLWKRMLFGISLAVFCTMLIAASIHVQRVQSRQQSPGYQREMLLKHDAKEFSVQLSIFAADFDKNPNDSTVVFSEIYKDRFNEIATSLSKEGLDTMKLYQLGHEQKSDNKRGDILKNIANEINRLADQLP